MTISVNESENVISIYYVKDETQTHKLSYTVEYYKDGDLVKEDTQTVSKDVWVNDTTLPVDVEDINVTDKYVGYKFEKTEPSPIQI